MRQILSTRPAYPVELPAPRPRRTTAPIVACAAIIAATSGCGTEQAPAAPPAGGRLRVLFIGNSLTAGNDLPRLVQAMAAAGGVRMELDSVTRGGFSLEDHWKDGAARKKLAGAKWDYVVLQQGPSSLPESQVNLKEWAQKWADEVRKHGAKPALYMVWPFEGQKDGFAMVSKSYRGAAEACKARILPAGEAWQEALKRDPKESLYLPDRLHPTAAGTYLAALVITSGLTETKPRTIPAELKLSSGLRFTMPEAPAGRLRRAAEAGTDGDRKTN